MKVLIVAVLLLALFVVLRLVGGPHGPGLETVADLKNPRVTPRAAQTVLVVKLTGDPATTTPVASKLLYQTYAQLSDVSDSKTPGQPTATDARPNLRCRWPKPLETPRNQWLGCFALPIAPTVVRLPKNAPTSGVKPTIETWEADTAAEILHVGPYADEAPTLMRLQQFITTSGYKIAGDLEEEYLRGPGLIFSGAPQTYLTMLRYPVKKRE